METPQPTLRPEDAPQLQLDAQGNLAEDIPCRKCAYNLRGLSPEGRCPECGTPVGLSTHGDLLRFADPNWIETVARGITILLWMILVMMLANCVLSLGQVEGTLAGAIGIALALINIYGAWLMTEPDPSGIGEDPTITARKVIRFTLIVAIVTQIATLAFPVLPQRGFMFILLGVLAIVAGIIGLVGEFAKFVYYEYLARRIPDPKLAGRARFLKWGYIVCLGIVLIGGLVFALTVAWGGPTGVTAPVPATVPAAGPATAPTAVAVPGAGAGMAGAFGVFACLMIPAGIGWLIVGILTIFLLIRLRRALLQEAEKARLLWASAAGTAEIG